MYVYLFVKPYGDIMIDLLIFLGFMVQQHSSHFALKNKDEMRVIVVQGR